MLVTPPVGWALVFVGAGVLLEDYAPNELVALLFGLAGAAVLWASRGRAGAA